MASVGIILCMLACLAGVYGTQDEYRLLNDKFSNYSNIIRPVAKSSDPIDVLIGAAIQQIIDMDEKNQVITLNLWMRMQWSDSNLVWDPADYGNTSVLIVPIGTIWRPDIVLFSNADSGFSGMMQTSASISHDGIVRWNAPAIYQSTCKIDITYFPFDEQHCRLKFGSWAYHGFQIDLKNRSDSGDISAYIDNGEWTLVGMPVKRNLFFYGCCPEPFPDVEFTVIIRRRALFYFINLLGPCVLISLITVLDFFMPADAGEKVTLGITILLALTVFLLLVAETMPPTSEVVPLIAQYYACTIVLVSLSTVMTVYVLSLHYRLPGTHRVPRGMKKFTFSFLARMLCMGSFIVNMGDDDNDDEIRQNKPHAGVYENTFLTNLNGVAIMDDSEKKSSEDSSVVSKRFESMTHDIMTNLKYIVKKKKEEDAEEDVMTEWKYVAVVFDRLFMWVFTLATVICTVAILCQPKPFTTSNEI
ncbi:neuronal acetylcholine receptor subunit alpha-10-like [Lytechinus variegatus]|uniref:neuronal acetylcholine receptor subunit alpha-10-like n=1 Tax=Lytechinus variegatus TaxID=7654 RepID=UPI001BB16783|nr:neuronal acetylcholine receptor subunit alpha-10-like [Lytechinus variegatus]XP_041465601.1 neuronal acetylcholine receptor subunit alpha-10-like [Lytechinus variegatus]